MKGSVLRVGAAALVAAAVLLQGCVVPWKKYITLKRKYEEAVDELAAKDSQLADANTRIDALRDQLKAKDQLIALYAEKKQAADELAKRAKENYERLMKKLDELQRAHSGLEVVDGTLIIKDELLFPLGSAEVSEEGKKILRDIAAQFKNSDEIIQIDGHTDDIPVEKPETKAKFVNNWGLAAMRARAVLDILAQSGIDEKRMYLRAFSMYRPRLPNATPENRAKNRRVEVMFFPAEPLPLKPAEGAAPPAPAKPEEKKP